MVKKHTPKLPLPEEIKYLLPKEGVCVFAIGMDNTPVVDGTSKGVLRWLTDLHTSELPNYYVWDSGLRKVLWAVDFIHQFSSKNEAVNHPAHYNKGKYEVIDVIEDWGLGFNDGNALKYIGRARHKGNNVEDLEKAVWYLNREIRRLKGEVEK